MTKSFRNPILFPNDKMYNYSLNSPMFIPILNEASPRPQTGRQHFAPSSQQPNAVNFTLNLNVCSDGRGQPSTLPTSSQQPQPQKQCQQCNLVNCQCHDMANLDKQLLSQMFQIDGQKSAMQTMNLPKQSQPNFN